MNEADRLLCKCGCELRFHNHPKQLEFGPIVSENCRHCECRCFQVNFIFK